MLQKIKYHNLFSYNIERFMIRKVLNFFASLEHQKESNPSKNEITKEKEFSLLILAGSFSNFDQRKSCDMWLI